MSMSTAVEQVEKGDRLEVWFGNAPLSIVVEDITEGPSFRAFQVSHDGGSFELNVPRGQTVTLLC